MVLVCSTCKQKYITKKIGVYVISMFMRPPEPYQIHAGDLLECPICGHQAVNANPQGFVQHFEPNFHDLLVKLSEDETSYIIWFEYERDTETASTNLRDYL